MKKECRLTARAKVAQFGNVRPLLWKFLLAGILLLACLDMTVAQQDGPETPSARVVFVFKTDPAAFSSVLLDDAPFASLSYPQEQATVWPVPSGPRALVVQAPGAAPKEVKADFQAGETYLLIFDLLDLPPSNVPGAPKKEIKLTASRLALPKPDGEVRGFAYLASDAKPLTGELVSGSSRDAKTAPLTLQPGKLTPIGTGRFSLLVGGKPLIFLNSSNPGLFVYLLFPDRTGELKPRSFEIFSQ